MAAHPPPVPPANRSDKGPGGSSHAETGTSADKIHAGKAPNNTGEQGQPGNTKQNTTHPGVVGDR